MLPSEHEKNYKEKIDILMKALEEIAKLPLNSDNIYTVMDASNIAAQALKEYRNKQIESLGQ